MAIFNVYGQSTLFAAFDSGLAEIEILSGGSGP